MKSLELCMYQWSFVSNQLSVRYFCLSNFWFIRAPCAKMNLSIQQVEGIDFIKLWFHCFSEFMVLFQFEISPLLNYLHRPL